MSESECIINCPKNSSYTIFFEFTEPDAVGYNFLGVKNMYDQIMSGEFTGTTPNSMITAGGTIVNIPAIIPNGIRLDCDINTSNMEMIFGMFMLHRFGINPKRLCETNLTLLPDNENPKTLKMKFSLGPPIPTNDPAISAIYPNDKYSSECIKDLVIAWILQYVPSDLTRDVEGWTGREDGGGGQEVLRKCTSFTSDIYNDIEYIPDIIVPTLGKFSNIRIERNSNSLIEELTNAGSFSGSSTPSTLFDYMFMYALPISFIGSIGFTILSTMQTDLAVTTVNKNILAVIYIYIFLCGFLSLCVWYKIDIVDYKIGDFKFTDWFSLGVIRLNN